MGEISGDVLASSLNCRVTWGRNDPTEFALSQGKNAGFRVSSPGRPRLLL